MQDVSLKENKSVNLKINSDINNSNLDHNSSLKYISNIKSDEKDKIKLIKPNTKKCLTLYKVSNTSSYYQVDKFRLNLINNTLELNFFDNDIIHTLLNFAPENNYSILQDKESLLFDIRLILDKIDDKKLSTKSNGNFDLTLADITIIDDKANILNDIDTLYLHNCEDKSVYKSISVVKNKNNHSYKANFSINLDNNKNSNFFKRTTKLIISPHDLTKFCFTKELHQQAGVGISSICEDDKLKSKFIDNTKLTAIKDKANILEVVVKNRPPFILSDELNLEAIYLGDKDNNIKWSYKVIKNSYY